ncbi:MAG TPA: Chromate resistance protein ChrB [Gemmatimonadales bacterium]
MAAPTWVTLSYRLPREPSRLRLAVWRRLRRLGAMLLHDAIWLLPYDAKTKEAFEWLADEIEERGGSAFIWESTSLGAAQDQAIVARFRAAADERYAAIAESAEALRRLTTRRRHPQPDRLEQARRQLAGLQRALRLEWRRDHFRALGRRAAEEALHSAGLALAEPPQGGHADAVGH